MWKCMRCEKENQDSIENCTGCGKAKSMDYINYRTLSRINNSVAENWKADQNTSEFLVKQGIEYLQKAAEFLEKAGLNSSADKTKEVIEEIRKKEMEEKFNATIEKMFQHEIEDTEITELMRKYLEKKEGEQKEEKSNIRIVEACHPAKQNTNHKKTKVIRVLNQSELDKRKNKRVYRGNSIEEICKDFLSYDDNKIRLTQKRETFDVLKVGNTTTYLMDDNTIKVGRESGFAITEKGIYVKEPEGKEKFISWDEFQKAEIIYKAGTDNERILKVKGQRIFNILYFTGNQETFLQLEMLFIAIHKLLNRKAE